MGDSADGIPGVPRWGAKSSSRLLERYRHLEEIPIEASAWEVKVRGAHSLAESLNAHREEVILYRTLATLRTDVPLKENLDDLKWEGVRDDQMEALAQELGAPRLLTEAGRLTPDP